MRYVLPALVALLLASPAAAQEPAPVDTPRVDTRPVQLSGPRVGVTMLTGDLADRVSEDFEAGPFISQFGWQFENRLFTTDRGLSGVTEWVLLVGGLEQSVVLPSATFLVGLRSRGGAEIGFGPNLSAGGAAYVIGAGVTFRYDDLQFPVNASVALSKDGPRISLLTGFTIVK
jgi:hypothetical protein